MLLEAGAFLYHFMLLELYTGPTDFVLIIFGTSLEVPSVILQLFSCWGSEERQDKEEKTSFTSEFKSCEWKTEYGKIVHNCNFLILWDGQLCCSVNFCFESSANRPAHFLLSLEEWSEWFWEKKTQIILSVQSNYCKKVLGERSHQ